LSADVLEPGIVRVFERWEDRSALADHIALLKARLETIPDVVRVLGRDLVHYEVQTGATLST
jgi:quinol monooxygenase YgiN